MWTKLVTEIVTQRKNIAFEGKHKEKRKAIMTTPIKISSMCIYTV